MGTKTKNKYIQIHCPFNSKTHNNQGDISNTGHQSSSKEGSCRTRSLNQRAATPTDNSPDCEAHDQTLMTNIAQTYRPSRDAQQSTREKREPKLLLIDYPAQVMSTRPYIKRQKLNTNIKLYLVSNNLATKVWSNQHFKNIAVSAEQIRSVGSIRSLRDANAISDSDQASPDVCGRRSYLMLSRQG